MVSDCDFWCYSCDAWLWFCVFFTGTRRKKRAWPGQNSGRQTVLAIFWVLIGSISDMRKLMFELIVLGFLGLIKVKSLVFPLPPRPWQPWDPPRPDKRKWPPLGAGTAEQELAAPKFKIQRDKSMLKKYQKMPGVMHFPPGTSSKSLMPQLPAQLNWWTSVDQLNRFDISNVPYFLGSKSTGWNPHVCWLQS